MSQQERDWLDWLKRARDKQLTQREAAEKMGVSERWVRKLLKRMEQEGDGVVVHGLRGRTSNRKISEDVQQRALQILREPDWHDFGPTYAAEQLRKRHQIEVSDETVRQWMLDAGLWKSRARRLAEVHTRGVHGAPVSESWCNGTPASTTGWKDVGRCDIWCG